MFRNRLVLFLFGAAVFFLGRPDVYAQKLYLITGGDFQYKELGHAIETSVSGVEMNIAANMPKKYLVRYNEPESGWNGPEISRSRNTRSDILTAIDSCPAGPNDAIFFYWCGHGAYDVRNGVKKHYLIITGNENKEEKPVIYRSEILGALKKKRPRLAVLITDSCNKFRSAELMFPMPAPAVEGIPPLFHSLFFLCRGTVDVNSSSPDQWAVISKESGALFSSCFCIYLEIGLGQPMSWEELLNRIDSSLNSVLRTAESKYGHIGPAAGLPAFRQTAYRVSLPHPDASVKIPPRDLAPTFPIGEFPPVDVFIRKPMSLLDASPDDDQGWSEESNWYPVNGDRIIAVNGEPVRDEPEYREAVKYSPEIITLTLIDTRGDRCYLQTRLRPQRGNNTRLGIYVTTSPHGGVTVTGILPDSPASRCRYKRD